MNISIACTIAILKMTLGAFPSPELAETITKHSMIETELALAIIAKESAFKEEVVNKRSKAAGLMQLTSAAVEEVRKNANCNIAELKEGPVNLLDAKTNVKIGTCYMNHLLIKNKGDLQAALAFYNGGWKQAEKVGSLQNLYSETANYVLIVERAYKKCMN